MEVKFVVRDEQLQEALKVFPPKDVDERQIYFFDTIDLDLYHADMILRTRQRAGKKDEVTAKLRGPAVAEVDAGWFNTDDGEDSKCEVDKLIGRPGVTPVSITAKLPEAKVQGAIGDDAAIAKLLPTQQVQLVTDHGVDCATLAAVGALGPVAAEVWKFALRWLLT